MRIARTVRRNEWHGPQTDVDALQLPWSAPSPANIGGFSATCWFTARDLFKVIHMPLPGYMQITDGTYKITSAHLSLSQELGGKVPVGVVQSAAGGTAVRNWVPEEALALCSQPWSGEQHYGSGPYTHSTLFNSMIHPFGTGPTTFSFVLWDQV